MQKQIDECERKIECVLIKYQATLEADMAQFVYCGKRIAKKNAVNFNVEKYAYSLWDINPMNIPGMGAGSIMQLMGELGYDFVEKFETSRHFCKWCNLVPNNKISGGKLLSSKIPKRKNMVGQIFRMCANSLKDSKNVLGYYFRRMKSNGGHLQAIVATAHKIATIFYTYG